MHQHASVCRVRVPLRVIRPRPPNVAGAAAARVGRTGEQYGCAQKSTVFFTVHAAREHHDAHEKVEASHQREEKVEEVNAATVREGGACRAARRQAASTQAPPIRLNR